jgi:hypothetical protein
MQPNASVPQEKLSLFKLVILVLSIVILVVLVIDTTAAVPREVSKHPSRWRPRRTNTVKHKLSTK